MDFSTSDWSFSFEEKPDVKIKSDTEVLPWVSSAEAWRQYNNQDLYEADKLVREWIALMKQNKKWCNTTKMRRYTFKMIFEQLYGREYDQKTDAKWINIYSKVLTWYSSRVLKGTSINGKNTSKTVYVISPTRLKNPPYSLKLRLEWLAEQGKIPTNKNMRLPKDMPVGTARNKKTAENMERRRQLGRERYNARYADRAH